MKIYLIIIFFIITTIGIGSAQQSDINRFNYLGQFVSNPAATAIDELLEVGAYFQQSFTDIERAPTSIGASFALPFTYQNMGVGLAFQSERSGLIRYSNIIASYAFKLKLSSDSQLSFGLSSQMSQYRFEGSSAIVSNMGDPLGITINNNAISMNFSAGLLYSYSSSFRYEENYNLKLGISGGKLIPLDVNFSDNFNLSEEYFLHSLISGRIRLNESIKLSAVIQSRYETSDLFLVSANVRSIFANTVITGLRLDHNRFFSFEIGGIIKEGVFGDGELHIIAHGDMPTNAINEFVNPGYGIGIYYLFDKNSY